LFSDKRSDLRCNIDEQKGSDEPMKTCGAMRDNYLECLHGKAEVRKFFAPRR
jgi:hypothetical protein